MSSTSCSPLDAVDVIMGEWRRERPDLDPTPQGVIGRLHRLAADLDHELSENFARFGITQGEFDVLAALRRAGVPFARSAGELADHTMVTSGGLTKRIDRLEARGLVARIVDPADTRRRVVSLTDDGVALTDAALTAHLELEHRLLATLGSDAAPLATILRRWILARETHP